MEEKFKIDYSINKNFLKDNFQDLYTDLKIIIKIK